MDINECFKIVLELYKKNDKRWQEEEKKIIVILLPLLHSILFRRGVQDENTRKDIIQCICLKIFGERKKYLKVREPDKFDRWIYRIACNEFLNFLKKEKPYKSLMRLLEQDDRVDETHEEDDPSLNLEGREQLEILKKAVTEKFKIFSQNERICFEMKYKENQMNIEIARSLDISPSQVGVHIFRSCKKLRSSPIIRKYLDDKL